MQQLEKLESPPTTSFGRWAKHRRSTTLPSVLQLIRNKLSFSLLSTRLLDTGLRERAGFILLKNYNSPDFKG